MKQTKWIGMVALGSALIAGVGWLYQSSITDTCYTKLGFIYIGNVLFWLLGTGVIGNWSRPYAPVKNWLIFNFALSVLIVALNQVLVFFFMDAMFSMLYGCTAKSSLFEVVQTNHLLPNLGIYWCIVIYHHYQSLLPQMVKPAGGHSINIKENGSIIRLFANEIITIQSDNNAVCIQTNNRKYVVYERLKDWETKLRPYGFIRVHRSALINPDLIVKLQSKPSGDAILEMIDGSHVKVSRTYKHVLTQLPQLAF